MRGFLRRNVWWVLVTLVLACVAVARMPEWKRGARPSEMAWMKVKYLDRPVHADFDDTSMKEVMAAFGKETGCTVVCPLPEMRVTIHPRGTVPLRDGIMMALGSVEAAAGMEVWEDGEMVVAGSRESMLQQPRVTVVYDVGALLGDLRGDVREKRGEELVKEVGTAFQLMNWGGGSYGTVGHFGDKLIVRASRPAQREVASLLVELEGK